MISIIDYGAGNLGSVVKALDFCGEESRISSDRDEILASGGVILPGVGAFGHAMDCLKKSGLIPTIYEIANRGTPFLGICLGMQLLFEESEESRGVSGLGLLKGKILRIPDSEGLKIPHMGWNSLDILKPDGILSGIGEHPYVYFVHSYYLKAENMADVAARTTYGTVLDVSVEQGNIFGTQFHPEKSGNAGLSILQNFCRISKKGEK